MASEFLRDFTLVAEEISILITLQKELINSDIAETGNDKKKETKIKWRENWSKIVQNTLSEMNKDFPEQGFPNFLSEIDLQKKLYSQKEKKLQSGLILLELVCFQPYFNLGDGKKKKSISIDSKVREKYLVEKSKKLGFEEKKPKQLESALSSTKNSMTKKWLKIGLTTTIGVALCAATMGAAAPYIGGLTGSYLLGLSGAAAVNAGLAVIGGGAIAAGGLGMAGGTAILVGGGALLGMGVGFTGGQVMNSVNSGNTLTQAVKLEVALKEIIMQGQYDTAKTQEFLLIQRKAIDNMENEIDNLRVSSNSDEKRINDLEKSVSILRDSLKRNQGILRMAA